MRRLFAAFALAALGASALLAQSVPGQNINMVSGTEFPGGDPWLQKQNEPSIAVSTRNPCHLLAGANDYRAVDVPGLPADMEIGDSWLGLYKSIDCGQTWFSTLVPGYLQDTSAEGMASPVKGLTAGADPVVRPGTGGLFFYSFIAFNRGSNVGKLAVARLVDHNNKEAGDPIQYIDTREWDRGSSGQFLDKPWMTVTPNAGACTINGQVYPGNTVHVAWSIFVGNSDQNLRSKLYYAKSSNCGASIDGPPTKLSETFQVNQGASIAVSPDGQTVYVAWRQFATSKDPNRVLIAKSTDGGRSFSKGYPIDVLSLLTPFDQGTTAITFRTNAYPVATVDHNGRLHVAIQIRDFAGANQSRVVVTSSTDGSLWAMPRAVDSGTPTGQNLHQIMPALSYAGGRLHMVWYDLRDTAPTNLLGAPPTDFITEIHPVRHTLDVRGARGTIQDDGSTTWETYGLLQGVPTATAPKLSQYLVGNYKDADGMPIPGLRQLQFNMPNLRLYAGGTRPFMGDYIDVAGLAYVPVETPSGQQWVLNTGTIDGIATTAAQTIHAVWTDNRDAKIGSGDGNVGYTPPGPACDFSQAHLTTARNANVYTSRITPGLVVTTPGNAKPSLTPAGTLERAFAVMVQNRTGAQRRFKLTIATQPADGGTASFTPAVAPGSSLVTEIEADVPARSSIARTVYVNSIERYPRIRVDVESVDSMGEPLAAATVLNPDIQNPDIQNPDIQNPDIQNPDIQNAEVHNPDIQNPDIQNPDIQNPDIQNPDIQNPDIQNPDIQNPDIQNPDIQNPDIQNPDIQNPDIQNPDIQNPDIQNPDIQNPDIQNGSITDVSMDVTNEGNTTSSYQVKLDVNGDTDPFLFQLIGRRVYLTPTASGCDLVLAGQNQLLFNISNPDLTPGALPDANSDDLRNATVLIRPGETIKVTLRVWDKDVLGDPEPGQDGDKATPFCPMLSTRCDTVTHGVRATVAAQAPNTGETEPATATVSVGPDLTIDGEMGVEPQTIVAGDSVNLSGIAIRNAGDQPASGLGGFEYSYYLSPDADVSESAIHLTTVDGQGPLASDGVIDLSQTLVIPVGTFVGEEQFVPLAPGEYFILAVADSGGDVGETDETNNMAVSVTPITVVPAPFITTTGLVAAQAGSAYEQTFTATGGVPPLTWSAITECEEGEECFFGQLPAGITLDPDGRLHGTPTESGPFFFGIRVTDASPEAASAPARHAYTQGFSLAVQASSMVIAFVQQPPFATTDMDDTTTVSAGVRIQDAQGAVIPGATVEWSLLDLADTLLREPVNTVTTAEGIAQVNFTGVGPGSYRIRATVEMIGFPETQAYSNDFHIFSESFFVVGPVGGPGGAAFEPITCPADTVAMALRGQAGDDIDRTELWCGTPSEPGSAQFVGGIGGEGGEPYALNCPAGTSLTGIHGRAGQVLWPGTVVDTLGATCTDINTAEQTRLGPVGAAAPASEEYELNCPAETRVLGLFGRQGALLDQIALICQ